MAKLIKKRTVIIIGFWVIFIVAFIVSHKVLSDIIIHYQKRPAAETKEAYQLITHYQSVVAKFYQENGRCPLMSDKKQIIPNVEAYHYVKTIRLLADQVNNTCFIMAVMRDDTPNKDVKNGLITIAYDTRQPLQEDWPCYTDITNIYTIEACRNNPLPQNLQRVLSEYTKSLK